MVDYTRTARRTPWDALPGQVQAKVQKLLGTPITRISVAGGGFTPGFAAIISGSITGDVGVSGAAIFVKVASSADSFIYPAYVREAEVLAALPAGLPITQLIAAENIETVDARWQILCFEAVDGYMPGNPWTEQDLNVVHSALIAVQDGLAALPRQLTGEPTAQLFGADPNLTTVFQTLEQSGQWPDFVPSTAAAHARELQQLCAGSHEALAGNSVLHGDLRADNIIIRGHDRQALFCDWNFLSTGPVWADWVALLPYAWHGGIDVERWLAESPLSAGANPDHIDSWLAILTAYMIVNGAKPEIPSSPQLRAHGRYTARVLLDYLSSRREWEQ